MSWQSFLIKFFMLPTKRKFASVVSQEDAIAAMRLATKDSPMSTPPSGTIVKELKIHDIPCEWITAHEGIDWSSPILYFHGGCFVTGGLDSHRDIASRVSEATSRAVLSVDYRLAPEHPFPAQLQDAMSVYQHLLDQGYSADNIVLGGDSAGANLALSTAIALRDQSHPCPAALFCFSPWVDLTHSSRSITENAKKDPMLNKRIVDLCASAYADGIPLSDPAISPVYHDLEGLPPTYICAGDLEILLDDAVSLDKKLSSSGVETQLSIWKKQSHAFTVSAKYLPEGRESLKELARFLAIYTKQPSQTTNNR